MEAAGGLKELVLRWFTETQATLVLNDGNFPDWFQGFAARKEAEELLRDKPLGCFLVRLSDKAVGFILSYKGLDRCRHFVITQNEDGQFVVSGDCQTHHSVTELIEHYKLRPILPFGEYLTSSCCEENSSELYDVVSPACGGNVGVSSACEGNVGVSSACEGNVGVSSACGGNVGVSVQALRLLWDHHNAPCRSLRVQQQEPDAAPPPALPPKSKSRKLTGTVSADGTSSSQAAAPVPQRRVPPSDTTSHDASEPQANASERLCPGVTYSELAPVESRSRTLPQLDKASSLPTPLKSVTCQTYSLHQPSTSMSEQQGGAVETLRSNPLYQSAEGSGGRSAQQRDDMYAEVPGRPTPTGPPEVTYEQVTVVQGHTYESLDDMKKKPSSKNVRVQNKKWTKFLPEYMKK